jgi:hypothetical protein
MYNKTGLADGNHTYNVTICDLANNCNSTETRLINLDNSNPSIQYDSLTASDNSYRSQDYIEINVSYTESYFANITWNINGTEYVNTTRVYEWNATGLSDGNYDYNVTLCDIVNNCNSTETRTIILDTKFPSFSDNQTNSTSSSPKFGETVQLNMTISEDTLLSHYSLIHNMSGVMANTTFKPLSETSYIVVENLTISAGKGTLAWQLWANDSAGNSNVSDIYYTVIHNTEPVTITPRITPNVPGSFNDLVGYCNATDSDSDNITYYYKWYKNDILNISGNKGSYLQNVEYNIYNLSSSNTSINDNWTLSCLSYDGTINGSWINTSVVITSASPSISNFGMTDDDIGTIGYQIDPITNSNKTFYVWFNVTDGDGIEDINTTWIKMWYIDESNTVYSNYSLKQESCYENSCLYNGSMIIQYYDTAGTWNINVYANDSYSLENSYNTTFTVTALSGFELVNAPIEFGSLQPNAANQTAASSLGIVNRGNQNIALNLSASSNLTGVEDPSYTIPIENINYANTSEFTSSLELNITPQTITNNLPVNNSHDLYFRISLPGIKSQQYSSNITFEVTS